VTGTPPARGDDGGGPTGPPPAASGPDDVLDASHPLHRVLEGSRAHGLLGPAPVRDQIDHALGFLEGLPAGAAHVVDLGAGGGVPGLVLAVARPMWQLVLLDAAARRCAVLEDAVAELGLGDRVEVRHQRAEDAGRGPLRSAVDAVVARSFGPPAVVAECAAPLLRVGGVLVVSEPPEDRDRWPAEGLALVGLEPGPRWRRHGSYQALRQTVPCPDRFPRRPGIPAKRPLF
jgi:16S rRNA (guanine527-N7)-methyltransferase